ncbi:hypothetical protein COHA_003085 [Chlorella ohadii]|uniref:Uncharacterized protein n=1 Tax=Chlorella ohadii TaxID=2649997 RepID=A0AAD5DUA1_9CHLO|nr:hypothetical protein COHA_003085 [Chlorella ohadii]
MLPRDPALPCSIAVIAADRRSLQQKLSDMLASNPTNNPPPGNNPGNTGNNNNNNPPPGNTGNTGNNPPPGNNPQQPQQAAQPKTAAQPQTKKANGDSCNAHNHCPNGHCCNNVCQPTSCNENGCGQVCSACKTKSSCTNGKPKNCCWNPSGPGERDGTCQEPGTCCTIGKDFTALNTNDN